MKPTFKTRLAWEQAQVLMQPALLRVVDNIRKQLESSDWRGTYKEVSKPIPGYHLCLTRREDQQGARSLDASQSQAFRKPRKDEDLETAAESPHQIEIDIWELCYQVCFKEYNPIHHIFSDDDESGYEVEIDSRLLDYMGEIDWQLLESKAQQSVRKVFESLPD